MGEGQARSAHHRHEDMGALSSARSIVDDHRHLVAGVIDEQLVPALVRLAHGDRKTSFPTRVELTKAAVPIPIRMRLGVFFHKVSSVTCLFRLISR
jgi:hypothetical protein